MDFPQSIPQSFQLNQLPNPEETNQLNQQEKAPTETIQNLIQDLNSEVRPSADTITTESGEQITPDPVQVAPQPMAPDVAKGKTERFLRMRDMLQARILSHVAKQPKEWQKYKMDAWEIDWLCEVWADVVGSLGHIPAWLEILIAETAIMTPKIMMVLDVRKRELIIEQQAAQIASLQNQVNNQTRFEANKTAPPAPGTDRPDSKKYWQVNSNGYFLYDRSGKYVKSDDPGAEKPLMSPEVYGQLIKYNGKEFIDQIFKIG